MDEQVDRLYHAPPEDFVAARNALAKQLRADDQAESAAEVRQLRRPSLAAWLVNRVSLDHSDQVEELARRGERLESVQAEVLAGDAEGAKLRTAATREREGIEALVELARETARNLDRKVNERVFEQVGETLQAASSDSELRDQVRRGRVTKERTAATLGMPTASAGGRTRSRRTEGDRARRIERARRELERLRSELAEADRRTRDTEDRVARAEQQLREAKAQLADRRRETRRLRQDVNAAEKQTRR